MPRRSSFLMNFTKESKQNRGGTFPSLLFSDSSERSLMSTHPLIVYLALAIGFGATATDVRAEIVRNAKGKVQLLSFLPVGEIDAPNSISIEKVGEDSVEDVQCSFPTQLVLNESHPLRIP